MKTFASLKDIILIPSVFLITFQIKFVKSQHKLISFVFFFNYKGNSSTGLKSCRPGLGLGAELTCHWFHSACLAALRLSVGKMDIPTARILP